MYELIDGLNVQYGAGWTAPLGWLNFDSSPSVRIERLPLLGRFLTVNETRFPDRLLYGDIIEGLPVAPSCAKAIYASHVLEHLAYNDCRKAIANTYAILKPGGVFYFDTWNLASPAGWRRFMLEVGQHRNADPSQRKDVARNQFSTPEEVRTFATRAGLAPLMTMSDSPWVQMVALKPGGGIDADALRASLESRRASIAYTPLWTELFDRMIAVAHAGAPPSILLDGLDDDSRGEEIPICQTVVGVH